VRTNLRDDATDDDDDDDDDDDARARPTLRSRPPATASMV
jgi:hypothetical protein